jgi:hypothetical protein
MAGATKAWHTTPVGLLQSSGTSRMSSNGQPSRRLGYARPVQYVEGRPGFGSVWWGLQRSDGELVRRLGFQYLRIKIC